MNVSAVELLEAALADALSAREAGVLGGPGIDSLSAQEDLAWAFHAAHEADDAREHVAAVVPLAQFAAAEFDVAAA